MTLIFALKFITRLGILTGAVNLTKRMGIWVDPEEKCEITGSISADANQYFFQNGYTSNSICDIISNECSSAQSNLSQAIKRGYYFTYRLPDWTSSFLTSTNYILDEETIEILHTKSLMQQERSEYIDPWRHIDQLDVDVNAINSATMKPPKIKDDITCGKRVLV